MGFDVYGMCNALYDLQAEVSDELLASLQVEKGAMMLISEEEQRLVVPRVYTHIVNAESGGSGANTMYGVALLGGTACYTSRVGSDEHAGLYRDGLAEWGVKANLGTGEGETGLCLVLITPDAERTLLTFLGCARALDEEHLNLDDLRASRYLYITGYLWDTENQKRAVLRAMREANAAGVKVAFSLADPFCVDRHKDDFLRLLRDHVDLVIGNLVEAQAITGEQDPRAALDRLAEWSEMAVVTQDVRGALLRRRDETVEVPAYPVQAIDSTGAGDMYAAGILYGLTHSLSLEVTGRLAAYCAARVVGKLGPRLSELDREAVARILEGGAA